MSSSGAGGDIGSGTGSKDGGPGLFRRQLDEGEKYNECHAIYHEM